MSRILRPWTVCLMVVSMVPSLVRAQAPAAPQNARGYRLPAEVLLKWDPAEGAAYYSVYSGGPDRRWKPIAHQVTTTSFRDTDFGLLPGYYQIAAVSATGEVVAGPEFIVNDQFTGHRILGVSVRMLSENSASVRWRLNLECDAQVELGTTRDRFELASVSSAAISFGHELVVAGLQPGAEYWYRITSLSADGAGISYVDRFSANYVPKAPVTLVLPGQNAFLMREDDAMPFELTWEEPLLNPVYTVTAVFGGTVTGLSPRFEFIPDLNVNRTTGALLEYTVTDGDFSHLGDIAPIIDDVNDPPIAYDMSVQTVEDAGTVTFFVEGSDPEFDGLPFSLVTGPTNGMVVPVSYNGFAYSPGTNFYGIDHLTFKANDGTVDGNIATVRIHVLPQEDPPQAFAVRGTTYEYPLSTTIELQATDPDREFIGGFLTYSISQPSHGSATFLLQKLVRYQPAPGFVGLDSFEYFVSDGILVASARVTITVLPLNEKPIAFAQEVTAEFGGRVSISLTGSDPENQPLQFNIATAPANGSFTGTAPNVIYLAAAAFFGTDSFTFTVTDQPPRQFAQPQTSAPATITIHVLSSNAPPFAPGGLVAQAVGRWRIQLNWTDKSVRETGFVIERSDDGQVFRAVAQVAANVATYTDNGLQHRPYYYRVRAFNPNGASDSSNSVSVMPER